MIKTKNLLLSNIGISNVHMNNGDDDRVWSASSSKSNVRFVGSPTVLDWEGRNSFIRSVIEVNEHLMES